MQGSKGVSFPCPPLYHHFHTVGTDDADGFGRADDSTATGADPSAAVVFRGGCRRYSPACGCVAARDADAAGLVSVQPDFLNIVFKNPVYQPIGEDRAGITPSVFLGAGTDKAV